MAGDALVIQARDAVLVIHKVVLVIQDKLYRRQDRKYREIRILAVCWCD